VPVLHKNTEAAATACDRPDCSVSPHPEPNPKSTANAMNPRHFLPLAVAVIVSLFFTSAAHAQKKSVKPAPGPPGAWRVIGTKQAGYKAEHDEIVINESFDTFRSIKFKVTDAPLKIYRLVITYGNGKPDQLEVREEIPEGGETRAIDLKGAGTRHVRKIEFWYETKGSKKGKADVTVYGMR
jgi:hypothetical protein